MSNVFILIKILNFHNTIHSKLILKTQRNKLNIYKNGNS